MKSRRFMKKGHRSAAPPVLIDKRRPIFDEDITHEFPQPIAVQLFKLMMIANRLQQTSANHEEGYDPHKIAVAIAKYTSNVPIIR